MKRVLILALALPLLVPAISFAQGEKDAKEIQYSTSIGIGTAFPINPDEFNDGWNPSFGMSLDVAAARSLLELAASFDYSFFLADSDTPIDANVLAAFLNVRIKPLQSKARPYIFVGGGYFRYWIVDLDHYENVLGFGGGAGVEVEIDEKRRIFFEGKSLHGRTRETARRANTEIAPVRVGITFVF